MFFRVSKLHFRLPDTPLKDPQANTTTACVMLHYHGVHLDITIIKAFTCAVSFELLFKHMIFASKNVSWVKKSRKTECILNIRHLLRRNGFKMKLQIIKIKRGLHTMYIFYCHQLFTEKGSMSFRASNRVVFF